MSVLNQFTIQNVKHEERLSTIRLTFMVKEYHYHFVVYHPIKPLTTYQLGNVRHSFRNDPYELCPVCGENETNRNFCSVLTESVSSLFQEMIQLNHIRLHWVLAAYETEGAN